MRGCSSVLCNDENDGIENDFGISFWLCDEVSALFCPISALE